MFGARCLEQKILYLELDVWSKKHYVWSSMFGAKNIVFGARCLEQKVICLELDVLSKKHC